MSRLLPKLVSGLAALSVFVSVADAESFKVYRKRRGFFETLFGISPRQEQQRYITGDGQIITLARPKRRPAFDVFGDRIDYKDKKSQKNLNVYIDGAPPVKAPKIVRAVKVEYAEPEPLPGLGMGNLPYQPPLLAKLYDPAFATRQTDNPVSEAIRLTLADKSTKIRAVDAERKAVLASYSANGFMPLWTNNGRPTDRALAALRILAAAEQEGMISANYLPEGLTDFASAEQTLAGDTLKLAAFDVALTVKVLKYARNLSGGQLDPARLSLYYDIKTSPVAADVALRVLAHTPFVENYLADLAPKQPQYAVFKDALSKLKGEGQPLDQIADGPKVKPGKTDERIPAIRVRLQTLGFLSADDAVNQDEKLLDKKLSAALSKFQLATKVKQSGSLDSATIQAFNADHTADERERLIFNMERLRWLPKSMGNRYVFVNQPAYEVDVMEQGKSVWHSKVIVGRPLTQTYSFYDQIETVVFKPTWGVPASIIVNEYGPKSRKEPGYLDRKGFKILDKDGKLVSSKNINWWTMGQAPNFSVQQPSGDDNALGDVKFLFPNTHDIYMHDTPSRNLFSETTRAFSHGCVRVNNPREFASVLLGWDQSKVDDNIDMPDTHSVNLQQKTPVYLTYFTAWPTADGKIMYYSDIYGRDAAMAKAFANDPNAHQPVPTDKIVDSGKVIGGLSQN